MSLVSTVLKDETKPLLFFSSMKFNYDNLAKMTDYVQDELVRAIYELDQILFKNKQNKKQFYGFGTFIDIEKWENNKPVLFLIKGTKLNDEAMSSIYANGYEFDLDYRENWIELYKERGIIEVYSIKER